MRKLFFYFLAGLLFIQCDAPKRGVNVQNTNSQEFVKYITAKSLKENLYQLTSDEFEGRETGEPGQKLAANFLKDFYVEQGISSPLGEDNYFQEIPSSYFENRFKDTENVVALIEGSEFPEEIVVVSAHYDHLGKDEEGNIYYGADDNASGTSSVMEMAYAFQKAVKKGYKPRRTLLFMHLTGEEKGLLGSRYYTENPIYPLENTVANINTDMAGRIDEHHADNPNYVYLIGSDRLSTSLDSIIRKKNEDYTKLELDYTYNAEDDPNRFYFRSDHYNFAKNNIPVVFFFNGVHEDYHQPTDTPDKIDFEVLQKRTELIFHTVWEVANRDKALKVDKAG